MKDKKYDFRWVLDYGTHRKVGPWSLPVMEEREKASNQSRIGLRFALVEGRDFKGCTKTLAVCSAADFVGFQFRVVARAGIAIGSKGGMVGGIRYQPAGMELITQRRVIQVFDTGNVREKPRPEHYSRLTDIGRYVK